MFREYTKWDYELRSYHSMDTLLDRALSISSSEPSGPVYLVLPKEPLCAAAPSTTVAAVPRQTPTMPGVAPLSALQTASSWLATAKKPLIVTADMGRHAGGAEALLAFAHATGAGIIEFGKRNFFNAPTEDSHHLGFEPNPPVKSADLIIAIE
jgi:acetolactate synthase-1/2/3 large subunit